MTRPIPPRCTVAVPLLNEARYFPGLLAALLAQTYPCERMEILLVDGGSVDGTREMAEQAAADHAHIRFLHNERGMAAAALNKALAEAQGEYFVRLDARTRPEPDYVWACVRRLQEGRWAGVAGPQIAGGETETARVHALVLNHPLGAGAAAYRRARRPTVVDSL
ncbi:MAG: glycosyltransferase, partial [Chloroflexi bacterium]|nr:glycosyltransferase [Chloroflexota bacterium]